MISSIFWEIFWDIFCEHFFLPRSFQKFLPFAFLPSGCSWILRALLQMLVGVFFLGGGGIFCRKFGRDFAGFFRTDKEGFKTSGKFFGASFVRKCVTLEGGQDQRAQDSWRTNCFKTKHFRALSSLSLSLYARTCPSHRGGDSQKYRLEPSGGNWMLPIKSILVLVWICRSKLRQPRAGTLSPGRKTTDNPQPPYTHTFSPPRCSTSVRIGRTKLLHIILGRTPSMAGTSQKKFRKNSGKTPDMLSERFLEFPSRTRLRSPKPYGSRHLSFQSISRILSPSARLGGMPLFFGSGSGECLSELVMEILTVLRAFLITFPRIMRGQRSHRARNPENSK